MTVLILLLCCMMLSVGVILALYRLLVGPTVPDRIIAFDLVAFSIVGIIILVSVLWRTPLFIEIMLIFSLLGFVGTVAFISYLFTNPERFRLSDDLEEPPEEKEP